MAATAGEIELDLTLDQSGFNKQLSGIQKSAESAGSSISSSLSTNLTSLAKKATAAIAAAFAINKITAFAQECLELGSDLEEVQNVVDVTFSSMSESVNEWAAAAADAYGLSETMAKQYVGTFGSMAEAFGFTESEAYEMSTALTGLAGDVASFYNITQDEAYTKLKSVFSGETETLKDLGIVMTQSALDAYALANGYSKTISEMTEAEKVSLRLAFVTDQLSNAQGDFARTSDSWANQTRILELRMDSLKATIGQGLINAFSPALKAINAFILKLQSAAEAFEQFTELVFGHTESGSSTSVSESVDSATESTNALTESAEAAAEAINSLMGFDKISKLDDEDSSDSSDDTDTSSVTTTDSSSSSESSEATVLDKISASMDKVIAKAKELKGLFLEGFSISFGDSESKIEQIKASLGNIGSTLTEIFTDPQVTAAADGCASSIALSLGQITGAVASIGVSTGYNLTAGISQSLEENKGTITEKLSSILTLKGEMWSTAGNFASALGEIVSGALSSGSAVSITSSITTMFTTGFLSVTELSAKFGNDVANLIAQPIIDNKDKISEALENTLAPIATVFETLETAVTDVFTIIGNVYDEHIHPMLVKFKEGFSDSFGKVLDLYNQYIAPVLQELADKFAEVYEEHIKPAMEAVGEVVGKVFDLISALYENILKPLFDWIMANAIPIIAEIVSAVGGNLLNAFTVISDAITAVAGFLSGLIDTIINAIENVDKVPKAFKDAATAVINAFKNIPSKIKEKFTNAYTNLKNVFTNIGTWFSNKATAVVDAFKNIPSKIKEKFTNAYTNLKNVFTNIGTWFSNKATAVINAFKNIPSKIKEKFTNAYTNLKNVFTNIGSWFSDKATSVVNAFKNIPSNIKDKFKTAWTNIKDVFSLTTISNFFTKVKDKVVGAFTNIGTSIGSAVSDAFSSAMNTAFETIEGIVNTFIKAINGVIKIINNIPGVNISKLSEVELPRLAQGGYVEANTPQLAMIGDNRHQGEVVAPEDKLAELAKRGAELAGAGNGSPEIIKLLTKILEILENFDFDVYLDGESVKKKIVKRINDSTKAHNGVCEIIV